jgi:hypothetical protein
MANTTTKKRDAFLSRPLCDCALRDVPGVGETAHDKLVQWVQTPQQLLGHFMLHGPEATLRWLQDDCAIRAQEANRINDALALKAARLALV